MSGAAELPPGPVVLGVDVGTTAVKVVAFAPGSDARVVRERAYPLLEPAPGHQVQEPAAVLAAVDAALADCVTALDGRPVLSLGLSTAMHAVVGLDDDDRPTTPVVTWADGRAAEQAGALRTARDERGRGLHEVTGTPVHPMSPLATIAWFHQQEPATAARTRWWVGLKELLVLHLTGRLATESSSASATGLLDLGTGRWSPWAVGLSGARLDQLPQVLTPRTVLPMAPGPAARAGLPPDTPVVLGAADGPLGNLGVGATARGVVGLSLGTSGAVRLVVDRPPRPLDPALFCYVLDEGRWTVGGAVSTGGIVLDWAAQVLGADASASAADLLASAGQVPPGSEGLVMVPWLLTERAPLWDPSLTGAYLGLQRRHTRGHLVRAAMEGVALQLAVLVERLDAVEPVGQVRATGGTLRSRLWQDVLAAALPVPLHVVGSAEGSALGAAALALVAVGRAASLDDAVASLGGGGAGEVVAPSPAAVAAAGQSRELLLRRAEELALAVRALVGGPVPAPA